MIGLGEYSVATLLSPGVLKGVLTVEDCEDAWDEQVVANVTASADPTNKVVGSNSAKFAVADAKTAGVLGSETVSLNLSTYKKITGYIMSSVPLAAGDLQILLDDTGNCASPIETLDLPAVPLAMVWQRFNVTLATPASDTAIISLGLKMAVDKGAFNVWLDALDAVPDSNITGFGVDMTDYLGMGKVILAAGSASAGTNPTLDVKLQESDTESGGYTDIASAAFTQVTTSGGVQSMALNLDSVKKYIRALATIGGTSTPTFNGSCLLLGRKQQV